jgi:hypothetical protein
MSSAPSSERVEISALASEQGKNSIVIPFEASTDPAPSCRIDHLVFSRLKRLTIRPANLCSDAVFVRRAYLDVIGTLPTAEETAQFLGDTNPGKRSALIDRLLAHQEFADYWAMKWSDLLRIKAEFPINLWPNAAQAYYHWIRSSIRDNRRYDLFARELLTANGSNFRVPQVNFYRALQNKEPRAIAQAVALTFMGVRAEKWPEARLREMSVFFSQIDYKPTREWKEEIVFFNPEKMRAPRSATFPDGVRVQLRPEQDARLVFATWLTSPQNPWFARNMVNRIWSWLLGRGIVHEPDDMRPDNPPQNPELLAYLAQELVASHYDLKRIYRLILNSKTYQLSSIPATENPAGAANFAYYPLRRLSAEVLIDALCQITGSGEEYTSAVPEPFTVMPAGERAIRLPDGSISSSFLELFGRPPRDTGLESERSDRPSAAQRLHLLNSTHIQRKIEQSEPLQDLVRNAKQPRDVVNGLYLMILSRYPTDEEWEIVKAYSGGALKRRDAVVDLAWALINTSEFLYRH